MTKPDYHQFRKGDEVPRFTFSVSAEEARAYLDATGASAQAALWAEQVPPLAVGALLLAGLMDEVPLPDGAVHVGQDFDFLGAIAPGEPIEARMDIAMQSIRQGTNVVVFGSELRCGERLVMRGRTTIMAPVPEGVAQ